MILPADSYGAIFARNVRDVRLLQDLTQQDVAHRSGLTQQYVGKIERCTVNPTLGTMERVARGLNRDLLDLLTLPHR